MRPVIAGQDGGIRRRLHDGIDHAVRVDPDLPADHVIIRCKGLLTSEFAFERRIETDRHRTTIR